MRSIKLTTSLVLFLAAIFLSVSCQKEQVCSYKIQGLWIGSVSNATATQSYALSIKPDGTLSFEGNSGGRRTYGTGTWVLTGADFVADVVTEYSFANVGVKQKLTAVFNSSNETLQDGKYVVTFGGVDNGTFSVTKVY